MVTQGFDTKVLVPAPSGTCSIPPLLQVMLEITVVMFKITLLISGSAKRYFVAAQVCLSPSFSLRAAIATGLPQSLSSLEHLVLSLGCCDVEEAAAAAQVML